MTPDTSSQERANCSVSSPQPPVELASLDLRSLRTERLDRLQATMHAHGLPACLFFNPANIRYATGTTVMAVWATGTFARHCLVPADSDPVLFETPLGIHASRRLVEDVRPASDWQYQGHLAFEQARRWAARVCALLGELDLGCDVLAVDKLDTPGFLALQDAGIRVVDSGPVTVDAREVKTPTEVALLRANGALGDALLTDFAQAVRPGVRECDLLAVLTDSLVRRGGEYLFTRLVASGENTNPWGTEAGPRRVRKGDLVGLDADVIGHEGYVVDVSRTFLCAEGAEPGQRDAYKAAHDCVTGMAELARPGISFRDFAEAAPQPPERYRAQRYTEMAHQAGLEDEGPVIPYPDTGEPISERLLKEDMILCLECYAGEVGAAYGVKLEEPILITKHGAERLCQFPFEEELLR